MISVRLSEEEYSALRRLCLVTGARSVSDLTRDAVNSLLVGMQPEPALGNRMDEFRSQLHILNQKVEELTERLVSAHAEVGS